VFATAITLFLVPCMYLALEDFHAWNVPEEPGDIAPPAPPAAHAVTSS
jgi:hypothetical protein